MTQEPGHQRIKAGAEPVADPRGLILEAYRMEGITAPDCRTIFLDWALGLGDLPSDQAIRLVLAHHADAPADHPMTVTLKAGLADAASPRRRGGRNGRQIGGGVADG